MHREPKRHVLLGGDPDREAFTHPHSGGGALRGASAVRKRDDVIRRHQLLSFLRWLIGKGSQADTGGTGRSYRHATAWCWTIEPRPVTTHHEQVGPRRRHLIRSWCLLIAFTTGSSCSPGNGAPPRSTAARAALLERIPAPTVVVCDGGSGTASAMREAWPGTAHPAAPIPPPGEHPPPTDAQPRTDIVRRLLRLSRELSAVHDTDDAVAWRLKLET
jgi:hypothetical protein